MTMGNEPRSLLRAEATLLRIPVFGLAVKGSARLDGFEFRHRRKGEGTGVDVVLRTERDGGSPYPGPLSRRIHMALLQLITERGFPFENPVIFHWRDLCRRMGLPNSGRRIGEFKAALRATWGLKLFGFSAIDGKGDPADWRRLYVDCRFANDRLDEGEGEIDLLAPSHPDLDKGAEVPQGCNAVWLAPWYLERLNALHSAPLDYVLWKRLENVGPLASRLYEFLLPTFYRHETIQIGYERLALAMPVAPQTRPSHAVRQFADALEALRSEAILSASSWETMKSTGRPKLLLARGALLDPNTPSKASAGEASPTETKRSETEPDGVPLEVAERFAAEFYRILGKPHQPYKSDLAVAQGLIGRFGESRAFAILPDAVKRLKVRFRNAETLGALGRYFEEAAVESNRRREEAQKANDLAIEQAARRAKDLAEDQALRETWANLPETARASIRATVLKEHPSFRRIPSLVEAACIQKMRAEPSFAGLPTPGSEIA